MLKRKMLRDIRENMVSYIACILIIAVGLMAYVSMGNLKNILSSAKDKYYGDYKFSDIFAEVLSMPAGRIDGLKSIKGIAEAEGKLVKDVRVLFRGREENVSMRLVSIDLDKKSRMNDVWIIDGILPSKGSQGIALGSEFFKENGLSLGQDINVIINGRNVNLKVTGIGQSPEYIYAIKSISDFLPSGKDFTVAYISYDVMENLFQSSGSINNIAFMLEDGYTFDDVKDSIEKQLEPYTLLSLVDKEDQMSNFMLSQEMNQLDATATAIPLLFLSISSIILWIMLKRLVEQQRTQIGMLKACGYRGGEILWHYMTYALFIGILGGIAGGLLGYLLSGYMANIYQQFFTLPGLKNEFSMQYFIFGILLATFFSILAGFIGTRSVMKLEPAEAMHPPAPPSGKKVFVEEISLLWENLTVQGKMAVRNIFRSKGRSLFTCIGVAFAFSLMAALFSYLDMFDVMILDQFKYVQKYDMKVNLKNMQGRQEVVRELSKKRGVELAEGMIEVPAKLKNGHLSRDTVIIGVERDSLLYTIVDKSNREVNITGGGIVLTESIAKKLKAKTGDIIEIECAMAKNEDLTIRVEAIVPQYIGTNCYMLGEELSVRLGYCDMITAAILKTDGFNDKRLKEELVSAGNITGIEETGQIKYKYVDMMDQFFFMLWVMAAIAVITGFAIIYNSSVISLSERKRELASLRVMGMGIPEVQQVVSFEQNFVAFVGMLAGIPLTYGFYYSLSEKMNTDLYTIPIIIKPEIFIYAFLGTMMAQGLAYLNIKRKIKRLDMVEVLKERE